MIVPRAKGGTTPQDHDAEFQQVHSAVLRECI